MKQEIVGPRKAVFFLLFISMFVFHANFVWADEWEDAGFSPEEVATWKHGGHNVFEAAILKRFFSSLDEAKKFTTNYCKDGFATALVYHGVLIPLANPSDDGILSFPPANPNDVDGAFCYLLVGEAFQLLGDNEALYRINPTIYYMMFDMIAQNNDNLYYISFGKGGRAVSSIQAIVTVKGSYKYQSNAGIQIVPNLRILKTAK